MPQPQVLLKPIAPIINWGNPITQGLVFDSPFYEAGGTTARDITNVADPGSIVASGATWDKGFYGTDLDFSAVASSVNFTTPAKVNTLTKMSYEALFLSRSAGGGTLGKLFFKGNTAGAPYVLIQQASSATTLEFFANWAGGTGDWDITIASNTWYHFVTTYDISSTSNNPLMYLNGVSQTITQTGVPAGAAPADTANLYIGNSASGIRAWDGKIVYGRIWNRILTPGEILALYVNPWRIYIA